MIFNIFKAMKELSINPTVKDSLLLHLHELHVFQKLKNNEDVILKGLAGSLKATFLGMLKHNHDRPLLICQSNREAAESLAQELETIISGTRVAFFPGGQDEKDSPVILNPRRAGLQMRALQGLSNKSIDVIVTSGIGLCQPLPGPEKNLQAELKLCCGDIFDLYALVTLLVDLGYTREIVAERPGEISLRGGILDIFPLTGESPHRFEFFGEQIDSIRTYDPGSQLSTGKSNGLVVASSTASWEDRTATILDYFPENSLLFLQDPRLIAAEVSEHAKSDPNLRQFADLESDLSRFQKITYTTLATYPGQIDIGGREGLSLGLNPEQVKAALAQTGEAGNSILIICPNQEHKIRLNTYLELTENPLPFLKIEIGNLQQGFQFTTHKLIVFTANEIFQRKQRIRVSPKFESGVPIRELSSLRPGDFVVHIDHGIGRYLELTRITTAGIERECLTIEYRDKDKVYVPVEKMDRVQKYSGKEGAAPAITKLGTGQWERTKEKTKKAIQKIAGDLIKLYSARKTKPGFACSPQTAWEDQLEDSFDWDETADQARAIHQVKADMEKPRPMDRLICGDVGYGKTEVAVRAAFKAINNGKQVAMLVPTTILAQQHAHTFRERLRDFPVQIEELSRFRTKTQQTAAVERLKKGESDLVIGTHRLLSNDIAFKDLGLLIVDEEQRFGVRHKEKLKALRETVDVLTLSATPIPRTLHFSLMGVRDMTLINTPPKDRLPIITEVSIFQKEIIREAIERELARGGQIFFVHNRIKSIFAIAKMLSKIVPGLKLAVAHGRMKPAELENIMVAFAEGEYHCLVSTLIIGSGVDMPRVNTLIVHRADQLGLSQLYQLRGRVGRSDRRAYAYLLTPPFKQLSFDAAKRLRTIEEFTELGAGFQVAMKDLEIRGTGNLLGTQQSGNINAVGFDLYTRLVNEAVSELKNEAGITETLLEPEIDCLVDIRLPAFFTEDYIADEGLRVNLYHRLYGLVNDKAIDKFAAELLDRFGPLPFQGRNLLVLARLRLLGKEHGLKRILFNKEDVILLFDESWVDKFSDTELFSKKLRSMIASAPVPVRFLQEKTFGLRLFTGPDDQIELTKKVLHSWT